MAFNKDESKVTWLTCPDCGSKIGVIITVGKATVVTHQVDTMKEETPDWPPANLEEKLKNLGVDTNLLNIEKVDEATLISPKKFLGDIWGQINDAIRSLGGTWIREGRESRWEIRKVKPQPDF